MNEFTSQYLKRREELSGRQSGFTPAVIPLPTFSNAVTFQQRTKERTPSAPEPERVSLFRNDLLSKVSEKRVPDLSTRLRIRSESDAMRAEDLTRERRDILGFNPAPTQEQRDRVAEIDREREALRQRSGQLREDARWAEYGQLRYRPDFYANSTRPRSTLDDTRRRAGGEAVDERYLVGLEHAGGVGSVGAVLGRLGNEAYRLGAAADEARRQADRLEEERQALLLPMQSSQGATQSFSDIWGTMSQADELQKKIDALRQEESEYRIKSETAGYQNMFLDPDFDKKSVRQPSNEYDKLNETWKGALTDRHMVALDRDGSLSSDWVQRAAQMTDDEFALYNYIRNTEGQESANRFLDYLEETLNYRVGNEQAGIIKDIESPIGRAAAYGLYGTLSGLDQAGTGLKQLFSKEALPTTYSQFGSSQAREDLSSAGPKLPEWAGGASIGQVAFDLTKTTANMVPSIAAGTLFGPGAGAAMIGSTSAGNAYGDALKQGYSEDDAFSYGVLSGAVEAGLSYALGGIGSLGGKVTGNAASKLVSSIDRALLRVATSTEGKSALVSALQRFGYTALRTGANIGVKGAGEGFEEYLTEVLSPVIRNITLNENNQFNPISEDAIYAGILGALSAGVLEGPGRVSGAVSDARTDRSIDRAYSGMAENGIDGFTPRRISTARSTGQYGTSTSDAWYNRNADVQLLPSREREAAPAPEPEQARRPAPLSKDEVERLNRIFAKTPPETAQDGGLTLPTASGAGAAAPRGDVRELTLPGGEEIPISQRTWQDASNRKVNAFQYDHPELRPYYQSAARALLSDLSSAVRGERLPTYDQDGYVTGYTGVKRSVSEPIEQALDNANLSYKQIQKAAEDLIADNGQENYAAAKKLELILDQMLSEGYTDAEGRFIEPDEAYIALRDGQPVSGSEYRMSEEELNSIMGQEPAGFPSAFNASPEPLPVLDQVQAGEGGGPLYDKGPESSVGAARSGFDPYTGLINQYGAIEPGENPARVVDAPKKTAPNNKVALSARTVMEAAVTPEAMLPDLAQMVVDGKFSRIPVSNRQKVTAAENRIRQVGYENALRSWREDVHSGKVSDDIMAMGAVLYNAAANAGDTRLALDIFYDYSQASTQGARATQANRILKTLTPSGQLYMVQKMVNDVNNAVYGARENRPGNVPVELWMQRVGENLADELSSRLKVKPGEAKTVAQTILSDLRRYANETAPKRRAGRDTRTEMDRIMDLFQNRTAYEEAWQAAKDTLSDTFENNPDALSAFDAWLDSSLEYTRRLTKELTQQDQIVLPEEMADRFLKAETDEARDAVLDEINQYVADRIPSTFMEKFNALRYLNMLGNLKTQVRNVGGNVIMKGVRAQRVKLQAAMENLAEKAARAKGAEFERTVSLTRDRDIFKLAKEEFDRSAEALMGERKYSYNGQSIPADIQNRRTIFKVNGEWGLDGKGPASLLRKGADALMSGLESYRRLTNWAMEEGDVFFARSIYADALSRYLKANGVTAEQYRSGQVDEGLLDRARQRAVKEAQEATFRDSNAFSDMIAKIGFRNPKNGWEKGANMAVQGVLPFRRTPANVGVRAVEYSPLGLIDTAVKAAKVANGSESVTSADVIASLSKTLTGTGLFALGVALGMGGMLSGLGSDDENEAELDEQEGGQAYALYLPDWLTGAVGLPEGFNLTLDWASPAAIPLFMGAELGNQTAGNGVQGKDLLTAIASSSNVLLNMSMLQGINDQLENISYSENPLVDLTLNSLTDFWTAGLTSTLGGQIERTLEDVRMSTYTDENSELPTDLQYELGSQLARVPGVDYQQIPFVDGWGRTESSGHWLPRAGNQFLNPSYTSSDTSTPAIQETRRLYEATGDGGVVSKRPDKEITVDSQTKYLSAGEYLQYATERGEMRDQLVTDIIGRDAYQDMGEAEQAAVIKDVYSYTDEVAKSHISEYEPSSWVKKVESYGVDPADAILYRAAKRALEDADVEGVTSELRSMLMEDTSLTSGEKAAIDKAILSEKSKVDYSSQESFLISQMSDAAQSKWPGIRDRFGLSAEEYQEAVRIYNMGKDDGVTTADKKRMLREMFGWEGNAIYKALGKKADSDEED